MSFYKLPPAGWKSQVASATRLSQIIELALYLLPAKTDTYSCITVYDTLAQHSRSRSPRAYEVLTRHFTQLANSAAPGYQVDSYTGSQSMFADMPKGPKRQFARALWLTFLAEYAKDLENSKKLPPLKEMTYRV